MRAFTVVLLSLSSISAASAAEPPAPPSKSDVVPKVCPSSGALKEATNLDWSGPSYGDKWLCQYTSGHLTATISATRDGNWDLEVSGTSAALKSSLAFDTKGDASSGAATIEFNTTTKETTLKSTAGLTALSKRLGKMSREGGLDLPQK
jgi:hypothetical protein